MQKTEIKNWMLDRRLSEAEQNIALLFEMDMKRGEENDERFALVNKKIMKKGEEIQEIRRKMKNEQN